MAAKKHTFSQMEKKVFMDILKSYSTLVENKNTDGSTLREKNVAWVNITREYNANPHVTAEMETNLLFNIKVTNKQLRRLWMNSKQRQREALTKERQHRMAITSITRLPALSTYSTSAASFQHRKQNILEKEYTDRFNRASEIHALEKELLQNKIREAKAKAELAELILERERSQEDTV